MTLPIIQTRRRLLGVVAGGAADEHFASVVLLSHFTGANGSTTFIDESNSAHTITPSGDAQVQNNKLELDGNADRLGVSNHINFRFGAGAFTVELFKTEFDTITTFEGLIAIWNSTGDRRMWAVDYIGNASPKVFRGYWSTNGTSGGTTVISSSEFNVVAEQEYDVCYERDGDGVFRIYVDGVMIAKDDSSTASMHNEIVQALAIGRGSSTQDANCLDGRMAAVRITKGVARYANDGGYTVPTLPLPTS